MRVLVGTCGWTYMNARKYFGNGWKAQFPNKLAAYASLFETVEVNSTFYNLPLPETARRWRKAVPDDFIFNVKMHRSLTHERPFEPSDILEKFFEIAEILRAEIVLIQTPKSFKDTEGNIKKVENFLSTLPTKFKYALELRGWDIGNVLKLGHIVVVDPFATSPPPQKEAYFRLHGSPPGERMYYYKYTTEDLQKLKEIVLNGSWEKIWVFFNNVWMYDNALEFRRMLHG